MMRSLNLLAGQARALAAAGGLALLTACSMVAPPSSTAGLPTSASARDVGIDDGVGVMETPDATRMVEISSPVIGQLYEPSEPHGPLPAVLMLHGSEGFDRDSSPGELHDLARHLAAQGFATLALCYFRCPGRPDVLQRVPLEYAFDAVQFLKAQPEIDATNVSVWGWSRGAELALLVGSHSQNVRSVIALYGSPWAVGGFGSPAAQADCAWTLDGACLAPMERTPVERIQGPVLVMVGQYDLVWPMAYSEQVSSELDASQHPHQLTVFPNVGHGFGTLSCMIGVSACRPIAGFSSVAWDAQAYVAASRAAFAQTVAFLKSLATSTPMQLPTTSPTAIDLPHGGGEPSPTEIALPVEGLDQVISLPAGDLRENGLNQVQSPLPGAYADVSVSASVQLVNPAFDQFVEMGCRSAGESSQYRLVLYPTSGTFQLARSIDGRVATLSGVRPSPSIHTGSTSNAIQLSCQGPRIAATINGERAAQVTDYSFASGAIWIGAGQSAAHVDSAARTPSGATIEADFSNVVVRQL